MSPNRDTNKEWRSPGEMTGSCYATGYGLLKASWDIPREPNMA